MLKQSVFARAQALSLPQSFHAGGFLAPIDTSSGLPVDCPRFFTFLPGLYVALPPPTSPGKTAAAAAAAGGTMQLFSTVSCAIATVVSLGTVTTGAVGATAAVNSPYSTISSTKVIMMWWFSRHTRTQEEEYIINQIKWQYSNLQIFQGGGKKKKKKTTTTTVYKTGPQPL